MHEKDTHIVYEPMNHEIYYFESEQKALDFIKKIDLSEGIPEEYNMGKLFMAKITHKSKIVIEDQKSNYVCEKNPDKLAYCDECGNKDCDGGEQYPFSNDFDFIGHIEMEEVK
jgi:hypothetical protein